MDDGMAGSPEVKQEIVGLPVVPAGKYFLCWYCPTLFSLKDDCMSHMAAHRKPPPSPYPCKICDKSYTCKRALGVHMRIHPGENVATCATCGKGFKVAESLKLHMLTAHTDERPHPCPTCPKKYASANQLNQHIRLVHLGLRPNSDLEHCPLCGRACKSREQLGVHLRTHTGERPFKCTMCSMDFAREDHLRNHARIHTWDLETPFKCNSCHMTFRDSRTLRRHKAGAHVEKVEPKMNAETEAPIVKLETNTEDGNCPENGLEFNVDKDFRLKKLSIQVLRMTCKTVADGVEQWSSEGYSHYVCCRCGRGHRDEGSAQGHVLRCEVPFKPVCRLCRKCFASTKGLKRHLASIHNMSPVHKCKICGKCFFHPSALRLHESRHPENLNLEDSDSTDPAKRHKCRTCRKAFCYYSRLWRHELIHSAKDVRVQCPECPLQLRSHRLQTHINRRHRGITYTSSYCGRLFTSYSHKYRHDQIHKNTGICKLPRGH